MPTFATDKQTLARFNGRLYGAFFLKRFTAASNSPFHTLMTTDDATWHSVSCPNTWLKIEMLISGLSDNLSAAKAAKEETTYLS